MTPASAVPCGTQSISPCATLRTKSYPGSTLPTNCGWDASTPVSITATVVPAPVLNGQILSGASNHAWFHGSWLMTPLGLGGFLQAIGTADAISAPCAHMPNTPVVARMPERSDPATARPVAMPAPSQLHSEIWRVTCPVGVFYPEL